MYTFVTLPSGIAGNMASSAVTVVSGSLVTFLYFVFAVLFGLVALSLLFRYVIK